MDRFPVRLPAPLQLSNTGHQSRRNWISANILPLRLAALAAVGVLGLLSAHPLLATPVTYQMVVFGVNGTSAYPEIPGPVVQVGNNTYGAIGQEIKVTFTFQGDTSNVDAWSAGGASGYEIRMGIASVLVEYPPTSTVLYQGTFDPSAGIYVDIDNSNSGLGFGSKAVWPPTAPGFPGEPVYPLGYFLFYLPQMQTYDLKSDFDSGLIESVGIVGGWSCSDGPAEIPCSTPPTVLPMTDGQTFSISLLPPPNPVGFFHTTLNPMIDFASFSAEAAIEEHDQAFSIKGEFELGAMSSINPVTDAVTLNVNGYSVTLPPGSFKAGARGTYHFRGVINGNSLNMQIAQRANSSYSVSAQGRGSNLAGRPVSISLTIGDATGTTSAKSLDD